MTTLIIVRHGLSESNVNKTIAGQLDVKLTSLGILQAQCAASYLKDTHFDAIYSSTLSRAYDTALAIAKGRGVEIIADKNLRETNLGDWQGKSIEAVQKELAEWKANFDYIPPNGESTLQVRQRVGLALDNIAKSMTAKQYS